MGENKPKVEVQPKQKTEQELAQEFIKEYNSMCQRHGWQIVTTPAFKARDDGTWSLVLQSSVGRVPNVEQTTPKGD